MLVLGKMLCILDDLPKWFSARSFQNLEEWKQAWHCAAGHMACTLNTLDTLDREQGSRKGGKAWGQTESCTLPLPVGDDWGRPETWDSVQRHENSERAGGVAQAVVCFSSKHEAPIQTPVLPRQINTERIISIHGLHSFIPVGRETAQPITALAG